MNKPPIFPRSPSPRRFMAYKVRESHKSQWAVIEDVWSASSAAPGGGSVCLDMEVSAVTGWNRFKL